MAIYYIWKHINIPRERNWLPVTIIILCVLSLDVYPYMGVRERSLVAILFIISIYYIKPIKSALESGVLKIISKISFGVYAIHNPILFSFSIAFQLWLISRLKYDIATGINFFITTIVVIVLAFLFYLIVEKWFLKKIMNKIQF